MKNFNKIYFFGLLLLLLAIVVYSLTSEDKTAQYIAQVEAERTEKNRFFRASAESPIENKQLFRRLNYYPPNPEFRVKARLEMIEDTLGFAVNMTDGKKETYLRIAKALFSLQKQEYSVLLIKPLQKNEAILHLLFTDKTTGDSTYGGGRYVDVPFKKGQKEVFLDFNLAYNPFCAYNPNYSCPLPPKENKLPIAITAGEVNYEHAD
ncbi:MAG: DUF1684 domain-containing protein [Verrucomicrobia bacterium]|nr:DUF1684 domain-containing protein [Cytophagales bacterium]